MACDFVYDDLEGFFPFQNMYVRDGHIDHFCKTVLTAPILNQQDNPSIHLTGTYECVDNMTAIYLSTV
jgi:hypothetical protein